MGICDAYCEFWTFNDGTEVLLSAVFIVSETTCCILVFVPLWEHVYMSILTISSTSSFLFVPVGVVAQGYVFSVNQKSIQGNPPYGLIARGNGK